MNLKKFILFQKYRKHVVLFNLAGILAAAALGVAIGTGAVHFGPFAGTYGPSATGDDGVPGLERAVKSGKVAKVSPMPDGGAPNPDQAAAQEPGGPAAQSGTVSSGGRTIDLSKPMVALTFDDGPYAPVGNQIMDCAEQYGGRVTFFVVGSRVNTYRAEIQRMADDGHEIGNHSMDHKILTKLGAPEIRAQIDRCSGAVKDITGQDTALVRTPGGGVNDTVRANISQPIILWNIDTLDWKTRNADQTVQKVLSQVKDGDIVLMHEIYWQSGEAAVRIIPELARRGFQMVTVSELAKYKGITLEGGKTYSSFR